MLSPPVLLASALAPVAVLKLPGKGPPTLLKSAPAPIAVVAGPAPVSVRVRGRQRGEIGEHAMTQDWNSRRLHVVDLRRQAAGQECPRLGRQHQVLARPRPRPPAHIILDELRRIRLRGLPAQPRRAGPVPGPQATRARHPHRARDRGDRAVHGAGLGRPGDARDARRRGLSLPPSRR